VLRCGLFHSSYSNSYVDLAIAIAIFQPDTGRPQVPRHQPRYTDHLAAAEAELIMLRDANPAGVRAVRQGHKEH
jgi:hypothetical protein